MDAIEAMRQGKQVDEFRQAEKERYNLERQRFMTVELLLDYIDRYLAVVDTRSKIFAILGDTAKDMKKLDQLEASLWKDISNSMQIEG